MNSMGVLPDVQQSLVLPHHQARSLHVARAAAKPRHRPRVRAPELQPALPDAGNWSNVSRSTGGPSSHQHTASVDQHAYSYSASDAPEARKNPALYSAVGNSLAPPRAAREAASSSSSNSMAQSSASSTGSTGTFTGDTAGSAVTRKIGTLRKKPEVLAPAGGWPQLRAAVENGADCVYFGLSDFNARARAANFAPEELPDVMSYLRERGVQGFVVLNVLCFDEELARLEERVRQVAQAGVDAVIVQDVGAVELIRRVAPSLPIHGSTQMTITAPEGAQFAAELGVSRVVVGRELSVREIAKVAAGTGAEVEAFVHGALCVSYSGQCFSSEAWGGRSANRGQCAQACRMPYGLIVDGQLKELGDMKYLLSPQDLMAVEHIPQLMAAGVSCFKIEGRLKGPEYVALTTKVYRQAVDAAWEAMQAQEAHAAATTPASAAAPLLGATVSIADGTGSTGSTPSTASTSSTPCTSAPASSGNDTSQPATYQLPAEQLQALQTVFARGQDETHGGLTPGFLDGSRHQQLVRGRSPRHRGLCLGHVAAAAGPRGGVVIAPLLAPVKRGDGVVFDTGRPESDEQGGALYDVVPVKGRQGAEGGVELVFAAGQVDTRRIKPGTLVWKTRDLALESELRSTFDGISSAAARRLTVDVAVTGQLGTPLTMTLRDDDGHVASASTDAVLAAASKRPMSEEDVTRAVGQLARTVDFSGLRLEQGVFLPASALKAVRRAAADALLAQRSQHGKDRGLAQGPVLPSLLAAAAAGPSYSTTPTHTSSATSTPTTTIAAHTPTSQGDMTADDAAERMASHAAASPSGHESRRLHLQRPTIRVLCRTPAQVHAALEIDWLQEVVLDFLEVHGLKEAVAAVKLAGKRCVVAMPRVLKPDEQRLLVFYLRLRADALLLRGAGCLQALSDLGGAGALVPPGVLTGNSPRAASTDSGNHSSGSSSSHGSDNDPLVVPDLEGDFSLNAANMLGADLLLRKGLSRIAPTHDLNAAQLCALARGLGPVRAPALEAVVHQHLPIFHTEHCVFCRFLSDGNSYKDCGHPCEHSSVRLRDHTGADHLVLADMGCRNTVFNAQAQSGAYYIHDLVRAGYKTFRVELVDQPAELVRPLLEGYRDVIEGTRAAGELWRWVGSLVDANGRTQGVGAGSLETHKERTAASLRPTARR